MFHSYALCSIAQASKSSQIKRTRALYYTYYIVGIAFLFWFDPFLVTQKKKIQKFCWLGVSWVIWDLLTFKKARVLRRCDFSQHFLLKFDNLIHIEAKFVPSEAVEFLGTKDNNLNLKRQLHFVNLTCRKFVLDNTKVEEVRYPENKISDKLITKLNYPKFVWFFTYLHIGMKDIYQILDQIRNN